MKLPQRQVADPRAQQNFEQLQLLFPLASANIADAAITTAKIADAAVTIPKLAVGTVLELAATGTRRKVAFGTGAVVFSAGVSSATTTVAHGLGAAPAAVTGIGINGSAIILAVNSVDATNIVFHADYFSALTGTFSFYWIAIG